MTQDAKQLPFTVARKRLSQELGWCVISSCKSALNLSHVVSSKTDCLSYKGKSVSGLVQLAIQFAMLHHGFSLKRSPVKPLTLS